jgi:MOSC domain-containing protein YiiM
MAGDGTVEGITLVLDVEGAVREVDAVEAAAGAGLEGDYHGDLTLIEAEALERLEREHGVALGACDTRRNVLTRGIDLNALVGRRFSVGGVEAVGVELAEPCTKLRRLTGEPLVMRGLVHQAGLRADVVSDGRIAIGDTVRDRGVAVRDRGVAARDRGAANEGR